MAVRGYGPPPSFHRSMCVSLGSLGSTMSVCVCVYVYTHMYVQITVGSLLTLHNSNTLLLSLQFDGSSRLTTIASLYRTKDGLSFFSRQMFGHLCGTWVHLGSSRSCHHYVTPCIHKTTGINISVALRSFRSRVELHYNYLTHLLKVSSPCQLRVHRSCSDSIWLEKRLRYQYF